MSKTLSVLLISPTIPSTGNLSTVGRLQAHFSKNNINTSLCSVSQLCKNNELCNVTRVNQIVNETQSHGILLLHAYKSGCFVICSCNKNCKLRVRYGLVFGGTDLNEDIKNKQKCIIIKKCIEGAAFSIAFTKDLKFAATELSPSALVLVKAQGLDYDLFDLCSNKMSSFQYKPFFPKKKPIIFVLPCSIRHVKDPLFVAKDFMDWASSIRHVQDVRLLILGSIMDKDFSSQFLMQLDKLQTTTSLATQWLQKKFRKRAVVSSIKGQPSSDYDVETWINDSNGNVVQHFPALTKEHFLGLLSDGVFYALINTSLSEGMSSAILEAMSIGVVVLARDIPSNKSIITDGYNGFLFRNGGGFVNQAKNLLNNDPLRQKIISNARTYARLHHSPCEEAKFYVSLAQSTFL